MIQNDEEYGSLNPETALKMNFQCDEEYGSLN
jgi:hypothetical protein